jgi:DNA-binding transcriptional MocR family regulator
LQVHIHQLRTVSDWELHPPQLVTELLEPGSIDRHLRRMRLAYRRRRDLIATYLQQTCPDWQWQLPQGGMQFWIKLPPHESADTVI